MSDSSISLYENRVELISGLMENAWDDDAGQTAAERKAFFTQMLQQIAKILL